MIKEDEAAGSGGVSSSISGKYWVDEAAGSGGVSSDISGRLWYGVMGNTILVDETAGDGGCSSSLFGYFAHRRRRAIPPSKRLS